MRVINAKYYPNHLLVKIMFSMPIFNIYTKCKAVIFKCCSETVESKVVAAKFLKSREKFYFNFGFGKS